MTVQLVRPIPFGCGAAGAKVIGEFDTREEAALARKYDLINTAIERVRRKARELEGQLRAELGDGTPDLIREIIQRDACDAGA